MAGEKDKLNLTTLNSNNFTNWKCRMEYVLKAKKLFIVIGKKGKVAVLHTDKYKRNFEHKDDRVKSLITQYVDDSQLEYIRNKSTAYEMWRALEKEHERKGIPGQLSLRRKLLETKMSETGDLEEYLNSFDKVLVELRAAGAEINEKDVIWNLLMNLPRSFNTFVSIVENLPKKQFKYEYVKTKLRSEAEKQTIRGENGNEATNITKTASATVTPNPVAFHLQ